MDNNYATKKRRKDGTYCLLMRVTQMGSVFLHHIEDSVVIFPHGEKGVPQQLYKSFFNMRHSSACNVIERCFGLLKMRWAILRTYSYFPIKTQFRIITTCCLLNNFIQREMPMDLDDDENQEINPPPPAIALGDEMIDVVEASDQWSEWRTALVPLVLVRRGNLEGFGITFRASFYNECEKKILSAFPGTDLRATPHIDSKIKLWRKQYNTLQDMLKISGFGWDDDQKMVLVDSDDVWQNYVRKVSAAKGMRNKPFPFYEDWLILFGKDRATGELAEDPADAVAAIENEDANATTEEGEQSPVEQFSMNMGDDTDYSMSTAEPSDSPKTGKKGARPAEGIPIELSEMAKNLGSFIENTNTTMVEMAHRIGYSHDLSQQRRLVNAELLKLLMSNTQRLMAASMIVKDEDKVDLFFSLDENDKMEWVSLLLEGWTMQAMLLVLGCWNFFSIRKRKWQNYVNVVKENRNIYNMVQDLKGNIRVYCRIRPAFSAETRNVIDFIGEDRSLVVLDPWKPQKDGRKVFQFNHVFGQTTTKDEIFKDTQPVIRSVMDGYNVCIFAYGQIGSGKTHTMVSKLEIQSCTSENGLSIPDASMHYVESTNNVLSVMKRGDLNRVVSSTAINNQSSHSHSVLTIHVHGKDVYGSILRSCLNLVDLARSEQVEKSEVSGDGLKEAQYIRL
ncbi:unnamed protein product [Camellia sinensis]